MTQLSDVEMDTEKEWYRMSFQENMELAWIPKGPNDTTQKFIAKQPAWKPGKGMPWGEMRRETDPTKPRNFGPGAFGGHVYCQAPLAAARVVEKGDEEKPGVGKLGIHSIQGVFTNPGLVDRPFVYEVTNICSTRSFSTCLITARQPNEPSSNPDGPYPVSDAQLPLGDVSFTCLTTFKRPVNGPTEVQEDMSPWKRYAEILNSRAPEDWEAAPQADIDLVREMFPIKGHASFPLLDMYKVDMAAFNADLPISERRELILYRLYKPLPASDPNAHIACHAFEADRNGLIMLGNHLGYGYCMGPVASLSYSFYVHVNADEAVMQGDGWWVQEVLWPRVSAGRAMMESRIWSPEGKHVASGYQDGMLLPARGFEGDKAKL